MKIASLFMPRDFQGYRARVRVVKRHTYKGKTHFSVLFEGIIGAMLGWKPPKGNHRMVTVVIFKRDSSDTDITLYGCIVDGAFYAQSARTTGSRCALFEEQDAVHQSGQMVGL